MAARAMTEDKIRKLEITILALARLLATRARAIAPPGLPVCQNRGTNKVSVAF